MLLTDNSGEKKRKKITVGKKMNTSILFKKFVAHVKKENILHEIFAERKNDLSSKFHNKREVNILCPRKH